MDEHGTRYLLISFSSDITLHCVPAVWPSDRINQGGLIELLVGHVKKTLVLFNMCSVERQCVLVDRVLDWDSGALGYIPGFAPGLLGDHGHVTFPLYVSVSPSV